MLVRGRCTSAHRDRRALPRYQQKLPAKELAFRLKQRFGYILLHPQGDQNLVTDIEQTK
jgi:hypothetical protein